MKRRAGRPIFWGLIALAGVGIAAGWWPGYVERVVAPGEIRVKEGNAYYVEPLRLDEPWFFYVPFDSSALPAASRLSVRENDRELTSAHAPHAVIATEGHGAYSHWGNSLYLSSSDNSDPRTNGRRYVVRAALVPRRRVFLALVAGLLLIVADVLRSRYLPGVGLPALMLRVAGVIRSIGATAAILAPAYLSGLTSKGRTAGLLASVRVAGVGVAAVVLAYFGYALLLDPTGTLELAKWVVIKLAMNGLWVAMGAVAAFWFQRRDLRSWRLAVALLTLAATGFSFFLREEVYRGNRLLPSVPSMIAPLLVGVMGAYLVRLGRIRQWYEEFWAAPGAVTRALTATLIVVLCLSAPMIWAPVVASWNASGWMDSHTYDTFAHNIISGKVPAANSQYMPVYQYGLAAVYYVFGHFFFAQQLVNVALAFLTVVFLCLSAWNLFRNMWAVLLIGVWAALMRQMSYAVFFTQIESWYIPIVAFGIFAWTSYWRTPSKEHLVLLAFAAAIGINTRNQGAFYFGWLCLAPLFIAAPSWRRRLTHTAIAVTILAASLLPWSVRNYIIDGRFSPSSSRNAYYVAILNDPRIGFYGVRYWEGWTEITEDYARRYPDPVERDRVMMRAGLSTPFTNFDWFKRAMFWRSLAFYGLLPPGVFATAGPVPTNWATEWSAFVYWRTAPLMLLPLSLLGLLTRPGRTTLFLAGAVFANVVVTVLTGGAEDRVSYPVLPMHMLMALAAIFPLRAGEPRWSLSKAVFGAARTRTWIAAALCLLVFLAVSRREFGRPNLYAPQSEHSVFLNANVELDQTLPSLNDFAASSAPPPAPEPGWQGRPVRLRLIALNYQCPPKFGGRIPYMPEFATDPGGATYYYAALLVRQGARVDHLAIAVSWFGATVNERLREGDEVEAEGRLMLAAGNPVASYWVRIEKARKVVVRSSEIPPFF